MTLDDRLRATRPDVRVCRVEIEPERVRAAKPLERPGLSFQVGGFELALPGRPVLVRAFNVLRQYEEADVAGIWRPTGLNFFDRVPKAISLEALRQVGGPSLAGRYAGSKKAELSGVTAWRCIIRLKVSIWGLGM